MTYGAPTNLDLSACTVSADGGKTSQTLAELGATVANNATAAATASQDAFSASTIATQASQDATSALNTATSANTAATAAQTTANGAVQKTQAGVAGGYVTLNNNSQLVVPAASSGNAVISYGEGADTTKVVQSLTQMLFSNGSTKVTAQIWGIIDSDNKSAITTGALARLRPAQDGATDLGMSGFSWGNIYSKTAVQVTSDAAQKTIVGSLGDTAYTDGQKLSDALFGLDTTLFQLNASIADKGADKARVHAGFIAQQVEAAITASGLDPAKYALWTNSPVYTDTLVDGMITNTPVLDTNGKQTYTQMLRYEQILCVLFEAVKTKILSQEAALTALTSRVTALEAKSSTTGSAG
ncbi:tail fiber domain-containing protein [Acetobacter persici]|uniref:tail fiber domain-containing protein n=1 Tax=Acetobacter persici TaxID=1076596 RepID=UPI0039ED5C64